MAHIIIFAGTFAPIHLGHMNIISRSCQIADKVIIAVGDNVHKHVNTDTSLDERLANIRNAIDNDPSLNPNNISITHYSGALADFVINIRKNSQNDTFFLVRGLRSALDAENEQNIAHYNQELCGVETVLLPSDNALRNISSTNINELISIGKLDYVKKLLPKGVNIGH